MRQLVLSLFPGIGLLDMAFEEEGFCVVRGPDLLWGGDIRKFHPPGGRIEGVIGGPPCQTFSTLANLVRAKGYEPRFGNLIPEFERVIVEAQPDWVLMENVSAAPVPEVPDYQVTSFILDNCHLDAGDGYGEQQERKRRFSFALHGRPAPNLLRWITPAALLLPRSGTVTQTHIDNSQGAKVRRVCTGTVRGTPRIRERAILSDPRSVPVALGGSGKLEPGARVPSVTSSDVIVYRWARMLELQGLPPDFLADAPFTVEGKRKAVANGVPIPMGRAIARAVKEALRSETSLGSLEWNRGKNPLL